MIRFRLLTQPTRAGALPPHPRDISSQKKSLSALWKGKEDV